MPATPATIKRIAYEVSIAKVDTSLRLVKGPLLRPGIRDRQGSMVSKEEIRNALHDYMLRYRKGETTTGFMHNDFENADERFPLVELYITDMDMTYTREDRLLVKGESNREGDIFVPEGSGMAGVLVLDDKVWKLVLDGIVKGFSIGGWAVVEPTDEDGNVLEEVA